MKAPLITAVSNPLIKELRALGRKKEREARGEFLVEGIQIVRQAIESGTPLKMLVVAYELLTSGAAREMLRGQERAGMRIVRVSPAAFESFAERDNPSGLAAVAQVVPRTLESLTVDRDTVFVVLHQVSNPGNLGAILRTADAVGAGGVIVLGSATDLYAPAAVKASRGALFTVPCVRVRSDRDLMNWLNAHGLRLLTTSDSAAQEFWLADLRPPLALLFGNEGEGLPEHLLRAGQAVRIPMSGQVDSLNLACAASVLLYEAKRQRNLARGE